MRHVEDSRPFRPGDLDLHDLQDRYVNVGARMDPFASDPLTIFRANEEDRYQNFGLSQSHVDERPCVRPLDSRRLDGGDDRLTTV